MKHFANRSQIGIEPAQSRMPVCPELPPDIGKRVDAIAIQPGCFRPPDAVLQKILLDHRILGGHVMQKKEKPTLRDIWFFMSGRIPKNHASVRFRFMPMEACGSINDSNGSFPMACPPALL